MNEQTDNPTPITLTDKITVRLIQSMGGDYMVVAAAKVSVIGEEALKFADPSCAESNAGLINYLMAHRHGTPFEHSSLTFFVHAPIFVWREWHRHRIGFSYNETSGRYSQLEPVFWIPRRDRHMVPVDGWKPGRPKFRTLDEAFGKEEADLSYAQMVKRKRHAYEVAYKAYQADIASGYAMEVARSELPVGIYSSCWVTCNPRSLMAFLSLRTHEPEAMFVSYPQAEIEEAARVTETVLAEGWPITYKAFLKSRRVGP